MHRKIYIAVKCPFCLLLSSALQENEIKISFCTYCSRKQIFWKWEQIWNISERPTFFVEIFIDRIRVQYTYCFKTFGFRVGEEKNRLERSSQERT